MQGTLIKWRSGHRHPSPSKMNQSIVSQSRHVLSVGKTMLELESEIYEGKGAVCGVNENQVEESDIVETMNANVPFLRLLQPTTTIAKKLILLTQHLARTKLPQTCRHARVLFDIDRKVKEGFVARGDLHHHPSPIIHNTTITSTTSQFHHRQSRPEKSTDSSAKQIQKIIEQVRCQYNEMGIEIGIETARRKRDQRKSRVRMPVACDASHGSTAAAPQRHRTHQSHPTLTQPYHPIQNMVLYDMTKREPSVFSCGSHA